MKKQQKEEFLIAFQEALKKNQLYSNMSTKIIELVTAAAFKDAETLSKHIGVLNFHAYHAEEGFTCFIAHDYGSGGAANNGLYVFAKGGVDAMAKTLLDTPEAKFQLIGANNIKPRIRIGGGPAIEESLEENEHIDH